jgi:copper(I)-binding protein
VITFRTNLILAPIAASALILSLAACGSGDDNDADDAAAATTMADDSMVDDSMVDDTMADDTEEMPGGEATEGDLSVSDAWVRQPAEGQTRSAAYGTIANNGDADVTLVGGSVSIDATVEIHETLMGDDGVMQMQEREDGFVIPAGGTFELEPGGPHIMMLDIDPADVVGDIDVTMVFADGTELTVTAPVRMIGAMDMEMDADDMDDATDG